MKTAGVCGKKVSDGIPVADYERSKDIPGEFGGVHLYHDSYLEVIVSSSIRIWALVKSSALLEAEIKIKLLSGKCSLCRRKCSRITLFMRLRWTALWNPLDRVTPNFDSFSAAPMATIRVKFADLVHFPERRSVSSSDLDLILIPLGKPNLPFPDSYCGIFRDGVFCAPWRAAC